MGYSVDLNDAPSQINCRQLRNGMNHRGAHLDPKTGTEERAKVANTLVDLESGVKRPDPQVRAEETIPIPSEFATDHDREDQQSERPNGDNANNDTRQDIEREGQECFTRGHIGQAVFEISTQNLSQLVDLAISR